MLQCMSKLTLCLYLITGFSLHAQTTPNIPLVFDDYLDNVLPRKIRIMHSEMGQNDQINQGLDQLFASASNQFSEKGFLALQELLQSSASYNELIVIDLREESHGFFNGFPVSWYCGLNNDGNANKTIEQIDCDENERLQSLALQLDIINIGTFRAHNILTPYNFISSRTEKDFMETLIGTSYIRLPVPDHKHPSDDIVDKFLNIVNERKPGQWLHLHCRGGKGRTTTFLVLLDIIKNANQVSLNDILHRQFILDGSNLQAPHLKEERKEVSENRLKFIERFYDYCRLHPDFVIKWSEWNKQNHY